MFDVTGGQGQGQGTFLSQEVMRLSLKKKKYFEFNNLIISIYFDPRHPAVSDCLTD